MRILFLILVALMTYELCSLIYQFGKEDGDLEMLRKGFDAGWDARGRDPELIGKPPGCLDNESLRGI